MILELYDLKKPFETGNKELDDINKKLFDEASKSKEPKGKYVQILTNKARTVYYVAAVRDAPFSSFTDFRMAAQDAFRPDQLFNTGRTAAYKQFRELLTQQLRREHRFEVTDTEARKTFDGEV